MLPQANIDNAIIEAAKLAGVHAWRGAFDEKATSRSISTALVPWFGISWGREIIAAVDKRPINRRISQLMARVRKPPSTLGLRQAGRPF